jgi:cytochrome c-type biogenesis protein CcmE
MGKGLEKKFKITDNTYDIQCIYKGVSKNEFREGELLVMQSYCPDINHKDNIIVKDYLTKHSMETSEW